MHYEAKQNNGLAESVARKQKETDTYQHTGHKTDFKYRWNNVESKSTEHKVDASTMNNLTLTKNKKIKK